MVLLDWTEWLNWEKSREPGDVPVQFQEVSSWHRPDHFLSLRPENSHALR